MTWAIGDIHGCFDQMMELVDLAPADEKIVFVGDYIDRGHKILDVMEFVERNLKNERFVFIRGNHEQMLIDAARATFHKEDIIEGWTINGGGKTQSAIAFSGKPLEYWADLFASLPTKWETEANYFVHGGMSPGVDFAHQRDEVLMWYRYRDDDDFNHGKFLVHGHTPVKKPFIGRHRANIDTGAVYGNGRLLTAVTLDDKTGKVISMVQA